MSFKGLKKKAPAGVPFFICSIEGVLRIGADWHAVRRHHDNSRKRKNSEDAMVCCCDELCAFRQFQASRHGLDEKYPKKVHDAQCKEYLDCKGLEHF